MNSKIFWNQFQIGLSCMSLALSFIWYTGVGCEGLSTEKIQMYPNTIKSLNIEIVHPNKGGRVLQNVEKVLKSSQRLQN